MFDVAPHVYVVYVRVRDCKRQQTVRVVRGRLSVKAVIPS